jgi:hypothetical protein
VFLAFSTGRFPANNAYFLRAAYNEIRKARGETD